MARVSIVKQIKVDGKWTLRSIPKKKSGHYDWAALPDADYFVEWRDNGQVSQMAAASGISRAPHACEGPIGGLATLQVNSAMQNFVAQEIFGQIQPGATDRSGRISRHAHG